MNLHLRPARWEDRELLLEWRNDPLTRQNSLATGRVSQADHERWLRASLASPDRQLYVAESEGVPVGSVRLDREAESWELSWTVAPAARGRGVGKLLVRRACELHSGPLRARIRVTNLASVRIARENGFVCQEEGSEISCWWRAAAASSA